MEKTLCHSTIVDNFDCESRDILCSGYIEREKERAGICTRLLVPATKETKSTCTTRRAASNWFTRSDMITRGSRVDVQETCHSLLSDALPSASELPVCAVFTSQPEPEHFIFSYFFRMAGECRLRCPLGREILAAGPKHLDVEGPAARLHRIVPLLRASAEHYRSARMDRARKSSSTTRSDFRRGRQCPLTLPFRTP